MLQQTQVKTVLPFYPRFLERFPTPAALARAREPQVLASWSGLGYYRRARHLHAAAREVVREHAGLVPRDPEVLGRLPGIGRYTRAAVLSIGFGLPFAVLDGNVARVLGRWFALDASVREPRGARVLWDLAESLVPKRSPGDWNQALMELGATICTPRSPRCSACPVHRHCRARALGRVAEFPPRMVRPAPTRVRRAVALMGPKGHLIMARRTGAPLHGMWEPPGVELSRRQAAHAALAAELARLGVQARLERTGDVIRHTITHRVIEVELWRGVLARTLARLPRGLRAVSARRPAVPLTGLAIRLLSGRAR
jgi:A/G-specific adenine glycosylase